MKHMVCRNSVTILFVLACIAGFLFGYLSDSAFAQTSGTATNVGGVGNDSSPPTVTATSVVVTATPTPANVFVAAGLVLEATANAKTTGTATPTPEYWVSATPTYTPLVVTNTPIPGNEATAIYQVRFATAVALTTGTIAPEILVVTATNTDVPLITSVVMSSEVSPSKDSPTPTVVPKTLTAVPPTSTPMPTPTPPVLVAIDGNLLNPTPAPTPTYPADLVGKILFQSRRARLQVLGRATNVSYFSIGADGSNLMALRPQWNWTYTRALQRDEFSADGQFQAYVQREQDFKRRNQSYIFYNFLTYGTSKQLTFFGDSDSFPYSDAPPAHVNRDRLYGAWDPAWSPTEEKVALVSNTSGNDEIWVVERDVWPAIQLTKDDAGAWDRHPSWSPDGAQIVFFSTRTGNMQLWIMDADGGNQRQLTNLQNEAWNPVWVKYPDS